MNKAESHIYGLDPAIVRRRMGRTLLVVLSIVAGAVVAVSDPKWLFAGIIAVTLAGFAINRPLWGLLLVLAISVIRPGELWGIPNAAKFANAVLLTALLVHKSITKTPFVRSPMNRWVALLLGSVGLSFLGAFWIQAYVDELYPFLVTLVAYFLILNLTVKRRDFFVAVSALIILSGVVAVLAVNQFIGNIDIPVFRTTGVTGGLFTDPNDFAQFLVMFAPLTFLAARGVQNRLVKAILYTLSLLMAGTVPLTGSRGGFVGLAAVGLLVAWYSKRRMLSLLAYPILFLAFMSLTSESYQSRMETILQYGQDASAVSRLSSWSAARRMFISRPLTGVGLGSYRYAAPHYGGSQVLYVAHSAYYNTLAELGIFGITAFAGMLVFGLIATHRASRRLQNCSDTLGASVARGLFIGLFGYIVTAVFLSTQNYPDLYWFLGLSASIDTWSRTKSLHSAPRTPNDVTPALLARHRRIHHPP